jgi:purine-binding chemotaxis protein CheW
VIETMRPLPIEEVGRRHHGVLGLTRARGEAVPVVDVAAFFGSSQSTDDVRRRRFVTIRVAQRTVALAVDEVIGVRDVQVNAWEALPSLVAASLDGVVRAMTTADAELVLALDAARMLPPEGQ